MAVAYKTHEERATGTQRIILRCKNKKCKCVWAYDYATGKRVWLSDDFYTGCPECHSQNIESNLVIGTVTEHVCDARCRNAKGPVCECSCGGAQHGAGFLRH